ncbi:hypothetical protein Cni_G19029 [Canna indica]|uniref:Uncharacterized protein n=1 Tax=Canna indica TaxID=4628 RepID=A0AAQ3QJC6_9LILI|nr:hypothetical protein Cni_G19029 [Canna indica]
MDAGTCCRFRQCCGGINCGRQGGGTGVREAEASNEVGNRVIMMKKDCGKRSHDRKDCTYWGKRWSMDDRMEDGCRWRGVWWMIKWDGGMKLRYFSTPQKTYLLFFLLVHAFLNHYY